MSRRIAATAFSAVLACALIPGIGSAGTDEYEDLGGFGEEDEDFDIEIEEAVPVEETWWDLDGSLSLSSSYNYLKHHAFKTATRKTNWRGLSQLRTRLNLQLDIDLPFEWELRVSPYAWYDWAYLARGKNEFSDDVIDDMEYEIDFADTYIEGELYEGVDLKLGRQVVAWGKSDSVRVLDVLNPVDSRVPGRADIEDLRRSVSMIRLDWQITPHWRLTGVAIPEIRLTDLPEQGSDFNPLPPLPIRKIKPEDFEDTEFGVALSGIFSGFDVSFHFADTWTDVPRLQPVTFSPQDPLGVVLKYDRIRMAGAGGNYAVGSWLIKAEFAWKHGFRFALFPDGLFNPAPVRAPTLSKETSRLDSMFGIEYYGFTDHTLSVEFVERHLTDYSRPLIAVPVSLRENSSEIALRWTAEWMNARLNTTVVGILLGGWGKNTNPVDDGAIIRLQGDYTIRDGLVATLGLLMYQHGELPPLADWGHNDRVIFDLKWSF